MAKAIPSVIEALRNTAKSLEKRADYQWGHMGSCNCGFLAQEITRLNKGAIHSLAMQRCGDWSEQLRDYCPTSGLPMDDLISVIIASGFDVDDLIHLERLSDSQILRARPCGNNLRHNVKADVIEYLNAWTALLETRLLNRISLPAFEIVPTEA